MNSLPNLSFTPLSPNLRRPSSFSFCTISLFLSTLLLVYLRYFLLSQIVLLFHCYLLLNSFLPLHLLLLYSSSSLCYISYFFAQFAMTVILPMFCTPDFTQLLLKNVFVLLPFYHLLSLARSSYFLFQIDILGSWMWDTKKGNVISSVSFTFLFLSQTHSSQILFHIPTSLSPQSPRQLIPTPLFHTHAISTP